MVADVSLVSPASGASKSPPGSENVILTVAGTGTLGEAGGYGGDNGPADAARLNLPIDVAIDTSGSLYIADYYNHRVRKVDPSGTITTLAGTGEGEYGGDGGPATAAALALPHGRRRGPFVDNGFDPGEL